LGQKTHPTGFRLGVIKTWNSRWFARRDFGALVVEDKKLRKYVKDRLYQAGISRIEIETRGQQGQDADPHGAARYCYREKRR
jgi:small subunit ribosomal protein S3